MRLKVRYAVRIRIRMGCFLMHSGGGAQMLFLVTA